MLFIFHKNVVFIVFNPVYGNFILTMAAKQHILDNSKKGLRIHCAGRIEKRPVHIMCQPHKKSLRTQCASRIKKACAHNVPAI